MSEKKFTVDEIRTYLESQDSMGDIFYNLNAENIEEANEKCCGTCDFFTGEECDGIANEGSEKCHDSDACIEWERRQK